MTRLFTCLMELCTICNKAADLHKGSKALCAQHYVEMSDEDTLYWDLHALLKEDMIGNTRDSPRRLLEAIKRKHSHLLQRYYYQRKAKQAIHETDEDDDLNPDLALALAHERAKIAGNEANQL